MTGERRVLLAAPRGSCAGVDRAVAAVEAALAAHGPPVHVRREIVHNRHVVEDFRARGVVFVEEVDEVPPGGLLVFSAHGVSPAVRGAAAERGLRTVDATCPLVTKVHNEARRFAEEGRDIVLIGHAGHEEVEGTAGEAPDSIQVVDTAEDVGRLTVRDPARTVWLSQTTLSVDETQERVAQLRRRLPLLQDPPSDDICYATQNRQAAVRAIAARCDLVLVVGSANSSNSQRLVEVAVRGGARRARLVEDADAVDPDWLTGVAVVGVTSGASVPEVLVRGVLDRLARAGWDDVEEVVTAEEHYRFAVPPVPPGP